MKINRNIPAIAFLFLSSFNLLADQNFDEFKRLEPWPAISYHIREGIHDLTPYDWQQFLKTAELHFNR